MPRRLLERKRAFERKPSWMSNSEFARFSEFENGLRPKSNGLLSPAERESLALLRWVQRVHSDFNPKKPE